MVHIGFYCWGVVYEPLFLSDVFALNHFVTILFKGANALLVLITALNRS